jgi:hypothetical protein
MKRYATVAGIFGASRLRSLRRASAALTAEWGNRLSSNMGTLNVFRGRGTLTLRLSPSQSLKANPFFPEFATADTWTVAIRSISKSPSLLVR